MRAAAALAFATLLTAGAGHAANPPAGTTSCTSPVRKGDTLATLKARFGKEARIETVYLAEGASGKALVLYPRDKVRRIEVLFRDGRSKKVERIRWEGRGWSVAGLKVGDTATRIAALNGRPFEFFGFDWDYGGYVTRFKGGRLEQMLGGCSLGLRLNPGSGNGDALMGEGPFQSSDPAARRHPPVIEQISLAW